MIRLSQQFTDYPTISGLDNLIAIFAVMFFPKHTLLSTCIVLLFAISGFGQSGSIWMVHNSPDPQLDTVDIWIDTVKVIQNFSPDETSYLSQITSAQPLTISICPKGSVDTSSALFSDSVTLSGTPFIAVLSGVFDSNAFTPSYPVSFVWDSILQAPPASGNSFIQVFNGSTDFGPLTIKETNEISANLTSDLSFGSFSPAYEILGTNLLLEPKDTNENLLGQFEFSLPEKNLIDSSVYIFLTGFSDPSANQNGDDLSIKYGHPHGGSLQSLSLAKASLLFAHISPDTNVRVVDVYVDQTKKASNVTYLQARKINGISSGLEHKIKVYHADDTSASAMLIDTTVSLTRDITYSTLLSGAGSASLPQTRPFELSMTETRTNSLFGSTTDILFFNGVPEAATLSIKETSVLHSFLESELPYAQFGAYTSLPTADYHVDFIANNDSTFVRLELGLEKLDLLGEAVTIAATGFMDTAGTSGLSSANLWLIPNAGGQLIQMDILTGLEAWTPSDLKLFPNPVSDYFFLNTLTPGKLSVFNTQGQLVFNTTVQYGTNHIDIQPLKPGLYVIDLNGEILRFIKD